jgi:hypothetical protein
MTERSGGSPAARLAAALLECTAPVTQILDHMARSPTAPDVAAAVATLRTLMEGVLAPLEERIPAGELERAAEIIDLATDAILEEILLVPHPGARPFSGGGGPRRRRRRRPH